MLTRNLCADQGLTNGAIGHVKAIIYREDRLPPALPEFVVVKFEDYKGQSCLSNYPNCVAIAPVIHSWRFGADVYSREQLPLTLGYAMTIHKCQGLTMRQVWIDTQQGTWAPEMLYVGLSRVRKLSDLIIEPFSFDYVANLKQAKSYQQRLQEEKRLKILYKQTKEKWNLGSHFERDEMNVDV